MTVLLLKIRDYSQEVKSFDLLNLFWFTAQNKTLWTASEP